MPDASMADATDPGGMCVNCLTVDAALWASGGMAVTATSAWGRVRDRVRSSPATDRDQGGANDVAGLISELDRAAESDTRVRVYSATTRLGRRHERCGSY